MLQLQENAAMVFLRAEREPTSIMIPRTSSAPSAKRVQALILRQIKPALDMKYVFLHADIDVGFLDARHLEDDRQSTLRFVDVSGRKKYPCRNCRLLAFFLLALLLNLKLLCFRHGVLLG